MNPVTTHSAAATRICRKRATGPRSPMGKSIASRNAIKYGFFAKEVVLDGGRWPEDLREFEKLKSSYLKHYAPKGLAETTQVGLAIVQLWQYRRLLRAVKGEILEHQNSLSENLVAQHYAERMNDQALPIEEREQARLRWAAYEERNSLMGSLPGLETIETLDRHENRLLCHFYRALAELERLQQMRRSHEGP